jgi:hypothetical protein
MSIKRVSRLLTALGTITLLAILALLTYSAGRGNCPRCGHTRDLYACKHCGWTACLACWQSMGKYNCPSCGRGSP